MNACNQATRVHLYHDGQLSEADRQAMEAHLQACPDCAAELGSLRELSGLFAQPSLPAMTPLMLARVHQRVDQRMNLKAEKGVLRLAQWLSAVAAAILVVSSLQLALMSNTASADTANLAWEMSTAMLTQDSTTGLVTDEHRLAAWVVDDLSAASRATPVTGE